MSNGGQCGLHSSDYVLNSLPSGLTYIPSEHRFSLVEACLDFIQDFSDPRQQPSPARLPEQPPRLAV